MWKLGFVILLSIVLVRILSTQSNEYEGKKIRLTGILTSEPREYGASYLVNLRDYSFFVPRDENIAFHSKISVEGVARGHQLEKVKVISAVHSNSLLSKIRSKILTTIRETLPEPESSLLAGITIGAPNIPATFNNALRFTGTSHVVVASGGNLAILAGFLEEFLSRFLKRKTFLPIIALILTIYSALTGFGAPIVRALIMWLIIMLSQFAGRVVNPLKVLLLTVLVMLIYKPLWINDVSFQLSVGATASIVLLTKHIEKRLWRFGFLKEAVATSLAAQVGTLPVSIIVFQDVKLMAPLWNSLVLWVVPYLTLIGLLGSLFAVLFFPLAKIIFLVSYPFGWYFVKVVTLSV